MARSIWTGAISFGLVTVPVKLYSAVSRKTVRFHQLNGKTGVRIQQKRVDPSTGDEVAYEDIVKGYELTPDRYVVIEPGELEALDPKKTKTIEIEDFVELDEIDPIFYDHPYYLAPGAGGAKPYRLLLEAMRGDRPRRDRDGRHPLQGGARRDAADGRRARHGDDGLRRRGHRPRHDRRARRRPTTSRPTSASSTSPSSSSTRSPAPFEPDKYHDTYREEVLALIERKAAGEEIAVQPEAEEDDAPVPDLMAALKASLDAVRDARRRRRRRSRSRRPRPRRRRGRRSRAAKKPRREDASRTAKS